MSLWPNKKQWESWSLPSKLTAIGALLGFLSFSFYFFEKTFNILDWICKNAKPEILCLMEYPITVEEDKVFRNTRNPTIIIENQGPVTAVSFSTAIDIYGYCIESKKINMFVKYRSEGFDYTIAKEELVPFDKLESSLPGVKNIGVYSISIKYHRKNDMNLFILQEYFFTSNKKIYTRAEFKENKHYQSIMDEVESFDPSDSSHREVKFTAADDHIWFVEYDPLIPIREKADGGITILSIPQKQSKLPADQLPHLVVTPAYFKSSGKYIKSKIEGDHINARVKYEVKNIGDVTAIILGDNYIPVVEIEPGQCKYYEQAIRIFKRKDKNSSLDEIMEMVEKKEIPLNLLLNIMYYSKNGTDKLYILETTHEFGEKEDEQIDYK